VNIISEQFLASLNCDIIFRVVAGICDGMWTRLRSSSPSSLGFLSTFNPPTGEAINQAVLKPWHRSVGTVGACLPPRLAFSFHLGGAVTPSLILPFRIIGTLINVA